MVGLPMLCIPIILINYPLLSIDLHVNIMFDLFMNLLVDTFFMTFICAPDYSFLCLKDEVCKLNFVTLFGLCWNIYTSQRLACLTLICSMFTCKVFPEIYFAIFCQITFSYTIQIFLFLHLHSNIFINQFLLGTFL